LLSEVIVNGITRAEYEYNSLERLVQQIDRNAAGAIVFDLVTHYNNKGQITQRNTVATETDGKARLSQAHYNYGSGTNYALGSVLSITTHHQKEGQPQNNHTTTDTNTYIWRQGAVQSRSVHSSTAQGSTTGISDYHYTDIGGQTELTHVQINDGQARRIKFTNDINGQVMARHTTNVNGTARINGPQEVRYRFAGREMGEVSNNGTQNIDYEASIARRAQIGGNGLYRYGETAPTHHNDFDQNYNAINSFSQSSAGLYTVQGGETLQGIAAQLWGDSTLWYRIAEANGLSQSSALTEGQLLTIPAGVLKNTHTADTFKPYDPAAAIGDLSPTAAEPGQNTDGKCGTFGKVLLAVVAVAIQFVPGIGQAIGAVANTIGSAVGGAVGAVAGSAAGGLAGSFATAATTGALNSAITQGIGVATGIQDKFSFKQLGLAAIGAGIKGINPGGGYPQNLRFKLFKSITKFEWDY